MTWRIWSWLARWFERGVPEQTGFGPFRGRPRESIVKGSRIFPRRGNSNFPTRLGTFVVV